MSNIKMDLTIMEDARKAAANKGFALLQWDFFKIGEKEFPKYSVQMPEEAVDFILELLERYYKTFDILYNLVLKEKP